METTLDLNNNGGSRFKLVRITCVVLFLLIEFLTHTSLVGAVDQTTSQQLSTLQANEIAQLAGVDNLANLGRNFLNSKRARKLSAFMPMRGRKDGRDLDRTLQLQQERNFLGAAIPEEFLGEELPISNGLPLIQVAPPSVVLEPETALRWLPAGRVPVSRHLILEGGR